MAGFHLLRDPYFLNQGNDGWIEEDLEEVFKEEPEEDPDEAKEEEPEEEGEIDKEELE